MRTTCSANLRHASAVSSKSRRCSPLVADERHRHRDTRQRRREGSPQATRAPAHGVRWRPSEPGPPALVLPGGDVGPARGSYHTASLPACDPVPNPEHRPAARPSPARGRLIGALIWLALFVPGGATATILSLPLPNPSPPSQGATQRPRPGHPPRLIRGRGSMYRSDAFFF
jgi:hypothetical protein